ncbi:MAG: hypothetical protein HKM92_09460 [Arenibacter sp.]|nr:hypothetical protein [Arenibacter sp.]
MNGKAIVFISILFTLLIACSSPKVPQDFLTTALSSQHPSIKKVMDSVGQYELQIKYTHISRDNDSLVFTDYNYQVNDSNYFYPASTVKLLTAILSLEKLNELDSVDLYSRFYIEGDSLETTFAHEISKIFAVSDNEANNRLFEFLGQDRINKQLKSRDIGPARISHRLSALNSDEVTTVPLVLYLNDSTVTPLKPSANALAKPLDLKKIKKGKAHFDDKELINEAFDFSLKNYYPINTQHEVLKRLIFPEAYSKEKRFRLKKNQRQFLLNAMCTLPKDLGYDPVHYYDGYCKFFMYGDTKDTIPKKLKIYNKAGSAYGTLTDCAYIKDTENKVEFLLTATLLTNANGILNDNQYEYQDVGLPFLAQLGREIYHLERIKKR